MGEYVIVSQKIGHYYRKAGSLSPNLRSDFKPEVELRQNGAWAVKISLKVVHKRYGIPVMP